MLSQKLYFLEIDAVHHKLWHMMLKMLNLNFLDWEDTLTNTANTADTYGRHDVLTRQSNLNIVKS